MHQKAVARTDALAETRQQPPSNERSGRTGEQRRPGTRWQRADEKVGQHCFSPGMRSATGASKRCMPNGRAAYSCGTRTNEVVARVHGHSEVVGDDQDVAAPVEAEPFEECWP